mgnify:CR=1 FL=1
MIITRIPRKSEYVAIILLSLSRDVCESLEVVIPDLSVVATEVSYIYRMKFYGMPHP